jgi:pSer/pThr/pTyr-binding forkhead associated (FHA) protein
MPERIVINIKPGSVFTIGRHSASVGTKQSDFEFPVRTKEVSRRHAVIERSQSGYQIVDIGSSAGTYVNADKIIPNVSQPLSAGDKVSFGRAGADYTWECFE